MDSFVPPSLSGEQFLSALPTLLLTHLLLFMVGWCGGHDDDVAFMQASGLGSKVNPYARIRLKNSKGKVEHTVKIK